MSNLLLNPNSWVDTTYGTPPSYWTGTTYTYIGNVSNGEYYTGATMQYGGTVNAGDIVAGSIKSTSADPTEFGLLVNGVSVFNVHLTNGQTYPFSHTLNAGDAVQIQVGVGDFLYSQDAVLTPAVPPVAPNLTVKIPNESSGTPITPQILLSGVPITGSTLAVTKQPTQGTVSVSADGTGFVYTPTLGTTMVPDSFQYIATSGGIPSNVATVNIYIFTQYNCACDMNDEPGQGFPTYTLDQMQRRVLVRLGMAAMPLPPPGMAETINTFLEDSQTELYRMYKCFRLKRWFTWQLQQGIRFYDWNADIENTNMLIATPVNAPIATPTTGTGTLAAGTYQYAYTYVNDNGESTPSPMVSVTLTATGEISLALVNTAGIKGFNVYRVAATGTYGESLLSFMGFVNAGLTFVDNGSVSPTTQNPPSANNTSMCSKTLDPRQIEGVYISRGDNVWQPLFEGIPPTMYTSKIQAIPQRYEVKQCIEIWPAPSDNTWQLRIVGDFALRRFNQPNDVTTIDPHAVYLKAIADCAMHYGKGPVGQAAAQSLELYIKKLIAGTDSNTRLWPGTGVVVNAIPPKMAGT